MLSLASARLAPGSRALLVFADDADPALHHLLAVALDAEPAASLTLMGRGSRKRAEGILGGFWTLPLHGAATEAERAALAASLTRPDAPTPRLVTAEATLEATVTLAPGITATARVEGWRGGTVALNGEAPAGEAGAALAKAWKNSLPEAHADLTLTVHGMGEAAELSLDAHGLRVTTGAPGVRLESRAHSLGIRQQAAGRLVLRHHQPLRLPHAGANAIIWAGFDPG